MIAAGIVTFEPELERFSANLESISRQVDQVFVFDNGSTSSTDIAQSVAAIDNAHVILSPENLGIATALNRLARRAVDAGHDWIVTLDQDSVAPDGMVLELLAVARECDAAMVTPYIIDINKLSEAEYRALDLPKVDEYRQAARRGAITSGALTRLDVLETVGGFDERFFIDYVDYDLNQRILLNGLRILRANRTYLMHEVGRARKTWLRVPRKDMDGRWRIESFYSFGHSSQRCYYKARNRVLFSRKYGRRIGISHEGVWQLPQQIALTILFESNRPAKLAAFIRGLVDGFRLDLRRE